MTRDNELVEMLPFRGFGGVTFGMTRDEIRAVLGEPDDRETVVYASDYRTEDWRYRQRGIELSFSPDDDHRLGAITFLSRAYRIGACAPIGLSSDELAVAAEAWSAQLVRDDEYPWAESHSLDCDALGLRFWCPDGIVEQVTMFAEYASDGDAPIWPDRVAPHRLALRGQGGSLTLSRDVAGLDAWCQVHLVDVRSSQAMGADVLADVARRLLSFLADPSPGQRWIFSMSERHCSAYGVHIDDESLIRIQDASARGIGRIVLTPSDQRTWLDDLSRLIR